MTANLGFARLRRSALLAIGADVRTKCKAVTATPPGCARLSHRGFGGSARAAGGAHPHPETPKPLNPRTTRFTGDPT